MAPWFKTITQSTLAVGRRNLNPGEDLRPTAPEALVRGHVMGIYASLDMAPDTIAKLCSSGGAL